MKNSKNFSDYMMGDSVNRAESVNRSFNQSPTSGVLHRQRNSYGPRLTLVNRSRDQSINHDVINKQKQQLFQKILLLGLQVERLKKLNDQNSLTTKKQIKFSQKIEEKQITRLVKVNQSFKLTINNLQAQNNNLRNEFFKKQQQYKKAIYQLQQTEKYLRENIQKIKKQLKQTKQFHMKEKLIQSNAVFDHKNMPFDMIRSKIGHSNSNLKSLQQKNKQIQDLRQLILEYEYLIKDQKHTIQTQKNQIGNIKKIKYQVQQAYEFQMKQIQQKINYELVQKQVNTSNFGLQQKNQELQLDLLELKNELKQKQSTIYQLSQNNTHLRENYLKLQSKFYDLQFNFHTKTSKFQQEKKIIMNLNKKTIQQRQKQIQKLLEENKNNCEIIQMLKESVKSSNINIQKKYTQMMNNLSQESKLKTKRNKQRSQLKITVIPSLKSIEQTSFFYRQNSKIKKVQLQQTIDSVQELKKSVQKNRSLIDSSMFKVKRKFYSSDHWKSDETIKIGKQNFKMQTNKNNVKKLTDKSNSPFQIYYKI